MRVDLGLSDIQHSSVLHELPDEVSNALTTTRIGNTRWSWQTCGLSNRDVARPVINEDMLYAACLGGEITAEVMIKTVARKPQDLT